MIKLGGIISRNAFVNEAESDKYTHIGYGMYKQKGKEKDKDAPTFKKDGEKYVPLKKGNAEKGGGTSAGKDKPKVNIFDKPKEKEPQKTQPKPDTTEIPSTKLKDIMPQADKKSSSGNSDIPNIPPKVKHEISMKIDELAKLAKEAREKGKDAPNYNLCQITVPGTNLYCDNNLGIPREEMPQFKGKPTPGSPASKFKVDYKGEVDTEPVFKEMLKRKGIKTAETVIPSDSLKATQSELVGTKVAEMTKALEVNPDNPGITAPIYVSRDGYVIDGHHRWAAVTSHSISQGNPTNMKVIVIDDDARNIIPMANKFAEEIGIASKKADANKETDSTPKDSTGGRAGHPETNKFTRTLAQKAGITPQKLGKDEYQKRMIQAAYSALVDSNYHDDARRLVAKLENRPEWAQKPDYPSVSDPDYKEKMNKIKSDSVDASEYTKADPQTDKFGIAISKESGWDGYDAIDAIAFDLKMNGFKNLASKLQSILEVKSTRLTKILNESNIPSKEIAHYTGTRETRVIEFLGKNKLDGDKIAQYVRKGNLQVRMSFVAALAGNPGNKFEKFYIDKFGKKNESVIKESRSLSAIAYDIQRDWKQVNYAAKPYLQAMYSLDNINDKYGYDSGRSIVTYFLSNAGQWKGDTAKRIKDELKKMLK